MLFCGCSGAPEFRFTETEINLYVGESRNLALYAIFEPATASDKNFKLESDGACVAVRGTSITAVSRGVATVTATNGGCSAKIKVNVEYRDAHSVRLSVDGDNVQTVGNLCPVRFSASVDDFADQSVEIVWFVNGERKSSGGDFVFEPTAVGEYEVLATASGLSASQTVAVYSATEAEGHSDGILAQRRDFSAVRFYADERADYDNPPSAYRWTVNGETVSVRPELVYTPLSAGVYEVELFVNGVKRDIDGADSAVITAIGDRAPNGSVRFDESDGGIYIVWNDGGVAASVSVADALGGQRRVYGSSDLRYSHLFGGGYFDASDVIAPCSAAPRTYRITVTADAAGEEFSFEQYPYAAEKYMTEKVLCKNSFITDARRAEEWVRELYAVGARAADGYLSREAAENKDGILGAISAAAKELGITAEATAEGNIVSVGFEPYVNSPNVSQTSELRQTRAALPHFEFVGSEAVRGKDYKLEIERAKTSVEVENTEQLLIAVSYGVRPEPAEKTAAAHVFGTARSALLAIIGKDYSAAQKAHAVYDWLQFCTRRVERRVEGGVSDFLEGVFGDGKSVPSLVVGDLGAAKAFALLCGMEGIECETECEHGNFYNRVRIDGLWYNVDVFDGEAHVQGSNAERMSHAGLFRADGVPGDGSSAYDKSLAYSLQKHTAGGVYFDFYINGNDGVKTVGAAVSHAFSAQSRKSFEVHMPSGKVQYLNTDFGAEFTLSAGLNENGRERALIAIENAAAEYVAKYVADNYDGDDADERTEYYISTIRTVQNGDTVWVTAQIPYFPSDKLIFRIVRTTIYERCA